MTDDRPVRVALYARVSTDRQEDVNQLHALRDYAARRGWEVDERFVFTDETSGGPSGEQTQFGRMMRAASSREFDVLLVWAWDRLTRRGPEAVFTIMADFQQAGIAWVSLKEPFLSSDADEMTRKLLASIVGWVAEYERRRLSERMKMWAERRKADHKPVGRRPGSKDRKPRTRRWYKRPMELKRPSPPRLGDEGDTRRGPL